MSEPGNEIEPQNEPEEKCLNCGTPLQDRFCGHCGQDKKEFKRSILQVFFQFFETFTDFDNKLWSSLGPLIYKPGFLTKKFLEGKRKSYLNPIQMYAFFSFLFFFTFFYMPDFVSVDKTPIAQQITKELSQNESEKDDVDSTQKKSSDSFVLSLGKTKINISGDSTKKDGITSAGKSSSLARYDSAQLALPPSERQSKFVNDVTRRFLEIFDKTRNNESAALAAIIDTFKSNIANLIILLLPVFAGILKVLYIRRKYYYVEHLIFAIHLHCFAFLLLSISTVVNNLVFLADGFEGYFFFIFILYFYFAVKNMYGQKWGKTFVKFNLLGMAYSLFLFFGFILNLIVSIYFSNS